MTTQAFEPTLAPATGTEWMVGGGEMGRHMREMDWTRTPLGSPRQWPAALKTVTRIVLASREPVCVWWGADSALIYNDACAPLVGGTPQQCLGQPAPRHWLDGSSEIGVTLQREGVPAEVRYALSINPVPGEGGGLGGVFCAFFDIEYVTGDAG